VNSAWLSEHVRALHRTTTSDDAATATLRELVTLVEGLSNRPAVAVAHVRPDDAYERLVVSDTTTTIAEMPSASAWRWIATLRRPITIDVSLRTLLGESVDLPSEGTGVSSLETHQRLVSRRATHLLAWPLAPVGGAPRGMISLELARPQSVGRDPLPAETRALVELLIEVSAPFILALPATEREVRPDPLLPVIGRALAPIVEILRVFAQQHETILLRGPTGAGKSRLARWCHRQSPRSAQPFETVDLGSVPEELQLGELFGWKRGAFTGATNDKTGAVARAAGGTLFIDEIDSLSLTAQTGLLRMFEERKYRPLGDTANDRTLEARLVVGTNSNLPRLIEEGRFREDLYYRLNVLPVRIPALDDRRDEIAGWARHFVSRIDDQVALSAEACTLLESRPWPGNLRQLDNVVRRAVALRGTGTEVTVDQVRSALSLDEADAPARDLIAKLAAFVVDAARTRGTIDLDLFEGFKGLALAAATEQLGGRDAALRLFRRETVIEHRNQQKTFRKEIERAIALCDALGVTFPFPRAREEP
jgi:DNA-binding NtrC family response regulator